MTKRTVEDLATTSLTPPPPDKMLGWGRLEWILTEHSTASMELKMGVGALARGVWQATPHSQPHDFIWTGALPLEFWGVVIAVIGALQIAACIWRWDKTRSAVATILCASLAYIVTKYLLYDPTDIATVLYATLLLGESWIGLRGQRMFGTKGLNGYV